MESDGDDEDDDAFRSAIRDQLGQRSAGLTDQIAKENGDPTKTEKPSEDEPIKEISESEEHSEPSEDTTNFYDPGDDLVWTSTSGSSELSSTPKGTD